MERLRSRAITPVCFPAATHPRRAPTEGLLLVLLGRFWSGGATSGRGPLAGLAATTEDLGRHVLVGCGKRKGHRGAWLCCPHPRSPLFFKRWVTLGQPLPRYHTPPLSHTCGSRRRLPAIGSPLASPSSPGQRSLSLGKEVEPLL